MIFEPQRAQRTQS